MIPAISAITPAQLQQVQQNRSAQRLGVPSLSDQLGGGSLAGTGLSAGVSTELTLEQVTTTSGNQATDAIALYVAQREARIARSIETATLAAQRSGEGLTAGGLNSPEDLIPASERAALETASVVPTPNEIAAGQRTEQRLVEGDRQRAEATQDAQQIADARTRDQLLEQRRTDAERAQRDQQLAADLRYFEQIRQDALDAARRAGETVQPGYVLDVVA